jgi:DNA-binding transcriptional MerR regulator
LAASVTPQVDTVSSGEEDARRAKHLGYTLGEIKRILEESRRGKSPCPLVRDIIQRRVEESRQRMEEERRLLKRMELALARWREMPDGAPDGHSICRLIESFDEV